MDRVGSLQTMSASLLIGPHEVVPAGIYRVLPTDAPPAALIFVLGPVAVKKRDESDWITRGAENDLDEVDLPAPLIDDFGAVSATPPSLSRTASQIRLGGSFGPRRNPSFVDLTGPRSHGSHLELIAEDTSPVSAAQTSHVEADTEDSETDNVDDEGGLVLGPRTGTRVTDSNSSDSRINISVSEV